MKLIYKKIDAFTDGISSGNPAGVVYLPEGVRLSDAKMQKTAKLFTEKNVKDRVNEVAFCAPEKDGTFYLRYFSFNCEVELCGHATIALMYDLIKNSDNLKSKKEVIIKTSNAVLTITNDINNSDSVFITAQKPEFKKADFKLNEVFKPFNSRAFKEIKPLEIVNGGLRTLILPALNLKAVLDMQPDENLLKEFTHKYDYDVNIVFTDEVSLASSNYRIRVFCPKYGYLEDPATGSANIALGYYLLSKNLWNGDILTIEQGQSVEHPNIVKLKTFKQGPETRVMVGGNGVVRFERKIIV